MNDGNGKITSFIIISGADQPLKSTVPPHLGSTPWIKHQTASARAAFKDVRKELKRLSEKITEKRVHDTRVALRRWCSIWKVLREDGWETGKCKKQMTQPLKTLLKLLGALRDQDVNLERGRQLGCTESLMEQWRTRRVQLQDEINQYVLTADIKGILRKLNKYLKRRGRVIESRLPKAKAGQSAFDHLELYLLHQESVVREEAVTAQTPEELHELRLSIKRWRYLLTEFFGVTNLELVKAQSLLGQLHDLDRLIPLFVVDDEQRQALLNLKERRKEILEKVEKMRKRLPFGLRPSVSFIKQPASSAAEQP